MDEATFVAFLEFGGTMVLIGCLSRWVFRMIWKTGEKT